MEESLLDFTSFTTRSIKSFALSSLEILETDAFHHGKKRNTGRTALIRSLASDVGTSVSNVYSIINDASISILDSNLIPHKELSASAAFHKRTKLRKVSNMYVFLVIFLRFAFCHSGKINRFKRSTTKKERFLATFLLNNLSYMN